ncbi:glutathione peroxidase [Nannochloropsis oceanica]
MQQQQQQRPVSFPLLLRLVVLVATASSASAFVTRTLVNQPFRSIRATPKCYMSTDRNNGCQDSSFPSSSFSRADLLKRTLAGATSLSFISLFNGGRRASAATTPEQGATELASTAPAPASPTASSASTPEAAPKGSVKTAYDYSVPYDGVRVPLANFKGKAVVVCNAKTDDPESLNQIPGLTYLTGKYSPKGLKIWIFTTEQGTFETDEDRVIRIKYYQQYGFGQYPNALIFDKIDVVGKRADPFYKYLCKTLKNPNKIARITLNFEKFLLDANGRPIRRYPRKYTAYDMEEDVKAAVAGLPLPPPSPKLIKAWRDAYVEAERSEYAFKKGLNYYEPLGEDQRNLP